MGKRAIIVSFRDLPECLTSGTDEAAAVMEARDALEEAVGGRVDDDVPVVPGPSLRQSGRRKQTLERIDLDEVLMLIEQQRYIVMHAPRPSATPGPVKRFSGRWSNASCFTRAWNRLCARAGAAMQERQTHCPAPFLRRS